MIQKIISGGQTGADRAALDWAINNRIPHGGWCPKGRRAEDGVIPERYGLQETPRRNYRQRTKWNVRDSDATLIITLTKELTGGTLLTDHYARKMTRPCLHVLPEDGWRVRLKEFLETNRILILNVAGPRRLSAPDIDRFVQAVLTEVLAIASLPSTASPTCP
jgi:hypothetical protein